MVPMSMCKEDAKHLSRVMFVDIPIQIAVIVASRVDYEARFAFFADNITVAII